MDYLKIYTDLCLKKNSNRIYTEKHRILPGCMGGKYVDENVVLLTPEEHYLAHLLLTKIYPNEPKLVIAMCFMSKGKTRTGKMYGEFRRKFSEHLSLTRRGKDNPFYGHKLKPEHLAKLTGSKGMLGKTHSVESLKKMSVNRSGTSCWNKGLARTDKDRKAISDALKIVRSDPIFKEKMKDVYKLRAEKVKGRITIWKNGVKRIVDPSDYTESLIRDNWVRSKKQSLL